MPHAHASGFPSPCVWLADRISPVGQDRLILICSGSGDPELQRWARCLLIGETHHSSLRVPNVWQHQDRAEKSRPGGLSYGEGIDMKHPQVN